MRLRSLGWTSMIMACGSGACSGTSGAAKAKSAIESESAPCRTLTGTSGSIVDGSGDVWTLVKGSDGGLVVDENGVPAGFSDQVVALTYVNHTVSQESSANKWWYWRGGTWNSEPDPTTSCTTSESPQCTTVTSTSGSIIDVSGNVWTLVTGADGSLVVDENGAAAGFSDQVIALVYVNHTVSQENLAGAWWSWKSGGWTGESNPTTGCSPDGGGLAPDGGVDGGEDASNAGWTAGSGEVAKMADEFVDTMGANTHFTFYGTLWDTERDSLIIPGLAALGLRHVRDALDLDDTSVYPTYADVYNTVQSMTGTVVRFDLLMPYPAQYAACDVGDVDVSNVLGNIPLANIDSFEGINEWNGFSMQAGLSCGNSWQSDLQTSQPALYENTKTNSSLPSIIVLGPALAFLSFSQLQSDAASVGSLASSMDYGAEHSYPGGEMPSTNIAQYHTSVASMNGPRASFACTESGWYTMPDGQQGISETAHGKYMSRFYFEYFNAGSVRTYVYDLIDDTYNTGSEASFGLMRGDGSFKPGATAVQNLVALLSDPGPMFSPGQLNYSLGAAPSQIHHTLLQKRSGTMYLVLWQEVNSYDVVDQVDLEVDPVSVNVDLGGTFTQVNQYDPLNSSSPFATGSHVGTLTVNVPDRAIVVEIKP